MPKKRADGRYRKSVTLPDGTVKYVYAASVPALNEKVRALLKEADSGVLVGDNTLVGEWAATWLKTYKTNLRANTIKNYLNAYNNHIAPEIAALPLKAIRPVHIQSVMNQVSGFSEDLQRKVLNTMNQIFETAIMNRLISTNPCKGIKITAHNIAKKVKALSPEQQEHLLDSVTDPRAKVFVALGLFCGLRREESLGLMWTDIQDGKLTVNRAVTFLKNQQDPNHELKSKAAHRTIPVPPPLEDILNVAPKEGLYVIVPPMGGEMTLMSYRRMWAHVTKAVDFDIHSHMLRHTYATSLYRAGIDLKTAQYLLGHSSIKMTAEIYTHIQKDKLDDAALKLNEIFSGGSKKGQSSKKA